MARAPSAPPGWGTGGFRDRAALRPPPPFTPDPARLYEVRADGRPFTELPPDPHRSAARGVALRRWWVGSVLLNAVAASVAALGGLLLPRAAAAWLGLLPLLTAPLLLVAPVLKRRGRARRHLHRTRPADFPPPGP